MDSRIRGNDKLQDGSAFFVVPAPSVVPAKAGTYASNQGWIPAYAESTPHKRPSHWTNILGGIGKKCSGGMTD